MIIEVENVATSAEERLHIMIWRIGRVTERPENAKAAALKRIAYG